jgi:hypothetical protein
LLNVIVLSDVMLSVVAPITMLLKLKKVKFF